MGIFYFFRELDRVKINGLCSGEGKLGKFHWANNSLSKWKFWLVKKILKDTYEKKTWRVQEIFDWWVFSGFQVFWYSCFYHYFLLMVSCGQYCIQFFYFKNPIAIPITLIRNISFNIFSVMTSRKSMKVQYKPVPQEASQQVPRKIIYRIPNLRESIF